MAPCASRRSCRSVPARPPFRRWSTCRDGQAIYRREAQPHRAATIVIDNADHEHPRRVFADFC
jgi:uridine kinase